MSQSPSTLALFPSLLDERVLSHVTKNIHGLRFSVRSPEVTSFFATSEPFGRQTRTPNTYPERLNPSTTHVVLIVNPIIPSPNTYNWVAQSHCCHHQRDPSSTTNILRKNPRVFIVLRSISRAFIARTCRSSRCWFFHTFQQSPSYITRARNLQG